MCENDVVDSVWEWCCR